MQSLAALLKHRADSDPDKLAYCFLRNGEIEDGKLSFRELYLRVSLVAAALRDRGAVAGDRVLLLLPQGLDYVVALYACFHSGLVAVPAYPPVRSIHVMRLQAIAADSDARLILSDRATLDVFGPALTASADLSRLSAVAVEDLVTPSLAPLPPADLAPDAVALLQYTSGSTGRPKGVVVTHGNFLSNQVMLRTAFGSGSEFVAVTWLPLFHDMGLVLGVMHPLFLGASTYLMTPLAFLQKPLRWLAAISRYRAMHSGAPNFAYDLCVGQIAEADRAALDLSSWRIAFNGAEPVRAETLNRFATRFAACGFDPVSAHPGYGLAEATLMASAGHDGKIARVITVDGAALEETGEARPVDADGRRARAFVSCGRPHLPARLLIVDPEHHVVRPPGGVGEVWLAGPHVAAGYWNDTEATRQAFGAHLADGEGPFLRTGDLGFVDADGELYLTSRIKDVIIIRGRNYSPSDIELVIERANPGIRENGVAAFTIPGETGEMLAIAAEISKEGMAGFDASRLLRQLRAAVANEFDLRLEQIAFVRRGKLPRTTSGKIQRSDCRRDFLGGDLVSIDRGERPDPSSI